MRQEWLFDDADPLVRFDRFAAFGDWWFESDERESELADMDIEAELAGLAIPAVLRRFYDVAKRWPFEAKQWYFGWNQNFFTYPNKLTDSDIYRSRGLIQFATENQGVTAWACVPGEDDPAVWDQEAEHGDAGYPFSETCQSSLADFLIDFLINEFAINGPFCRVNDEFKKLIESEPPEWQPIGPRSREYMFPTAGLFADEILVVQNPYGWVVTPRRPEDRMLLDPYLS